MICDITATGDWLLTKRTFLATAIVFIRRAAGNDAIVDAMEPPTVMNTDGMSMNAFSWSMPIPYSTSPNAAARPTIVARSIKTLLTDMSFFYPDAAASDPLPAPTTCNA